ncbi:MAG: PAS domain-containing protein [Coleofasciculus sp. A1-SPW-01]|uniref:PAS domain-containing sensor histidine kinase n=1 Tax=Coleofasciculus sp. A1-SPW-01 TaxID=3070819 RepID=UPI003303C647
MNKQIKEKLQQEIQDLGDRLHRAEVELRALNLDVDALPDIGLGPPAIRELRQDNPFLLQGILENTTDMMTALDLNWRYIAFNQAYKTEFIKIFGRDIDIGTSLIESLSHLPNGQAKAQDILGRALRGEEFTVIQEFGDSKRDRNKYQFTFHSIRDDQGETLGTLHVVKNLSEIERQTQQYLQYLLTSSPAVIFSTQPEPNYKLTYISDNVVNVVGYTPEQFLNGSDLWLNHIHSEDIDSILQELPRKLNQGNYSFEYRFMHADGTYHWLLDEGRLIRDETGEPIEVVGYFVDISDRKQTEKDINLQAVINRNIEEGICLVRANDGIIVYANPKFEQMFGYEPGELNNQPVTIIDYENNQIGVEPVRQLITQKIMAKANAEYTCQIHNVKKDGTPFWGKAITSRFEHPDYGTVMVIVQQDITVQKQTKEELQASLKEKEVLLKEIHHRVKNNLQIVSSLLQMQSRRTKYQDVALVLQDSQNRIASIALVHEKLYRSDNLAQIDFAQYVPDLITHLFDSYSISSSRVRISYQVEDIDLPIDTAIPCGLILNELVSNTLKYAFPEDQQGEIEIKFQRNPDNNLLTLLVRDNGVGIQKSFDIETTTSLGLTLVLGLVDQIDGTLDLNCDSGTEFRITFSNKLRT